MKEAARSSYSSTDEAVRRLSSIINKLIDEHPYFNVITVISNYTADGKYRVVLADCSSGPITISLKSFSDWEGSFSIKKIDSSSNSVTVNPAGSETIDGNSTITWASQYDSYTIVSNGVDGYIA